MNSSQNFVDCVILLPGNNFSKNFISCWSETLIKLKEDNISFAYMFSYGPLLSIIRNDLLTWGETTDLFDNKIITKKVIFIDSDIIWSYENFKKILMSEYDVISGVYLDTNNKCTYIKNDKEDQASIEEFKKEKKPFEIKRSGFGFVSCSFNVLNKMKYPWFNILQDVTVKDGIEYKSAVGEDSYFFNKLKSLGYKAFVDPSIVVEHEKLRKLTIEKEVN
jgi:hypothetical protein